MSPNKRKRKKRDFCEKKKELFLKTDYTCQICHYSISSLVKKIEKVKRPTNEKKLKEFLDERSEILSQIQVHHITPLSEGGSDDDDNLIVLCEDCHISIHNRKNEHYIKKEEDIKFKKAKIIYKSSKRDEIKK